MLLHCTGSFLISDISTLYIIIICSRYNYCLVPIGIMCQWHYGKG